MLNLAYKDIIHTFENLKVFRLEGEFFDISTGHFPI